MSSLKLSPDTPRQWRVLELQLHAERSCQNPFKEVKVAARFRGPNDIEYRIPGFWDGEDMWRIRFLPTLAGEWSFRTTCSQADDRGLHAQEGEFSALPPAGDNHLYQHGGILKVSRNKRYLTYSDGAPFFWLGDTWWFCPSDLVPIDGSTNPAIPSMFKALIDTRSSQGYTVVHWTFLGKLDDAGSYEDLFEGKVNPAYWRHVDRYVTYANGAGIIPVIGFGFHTSLNQPTLEQLQDLWSYAVARLGAYSVAWLICGEYNYESNTVAWFSTPEHERGPRPKDPFSEEDKQRIAKLFKLGRFIKDNDPYRRATTIHPYEKHHAWDEAWCDFIMMQAGHQKHGHPVEGYLAAYRRQNRKPVLEGECTYEGIFGFSDEVVRHNAYKAIQSGACGFTYGSHGLWYPTQDERDDKFSEWGRPLPWWEALRRPGGAHMGFLRKCYEMVEWWKLEPVRAEEALDLDPFYESDGQRVTVKADGDRVAVIHFPDGPFPSGQPIGLRAWLRMGADGEQYHIARFDPRTGTADSLGVMKVSSGLIALPPLPDQRDWVMIVQKQEAAA